MNVTILNLDGAWQFRRAESTTRTANSLPDWRPFPIPADMARQTEEWMEAKVPGCVHTDLMKNKVIPDPFKGRNEYELEWIDHQDWEYRREFAVDDSMLSMTRVELVCEGLDTLATVTINGRKVVETINMFIGHRFDIRSCLHKGVNEIGVRFENPYAYIAERKPLHDYNDGASFGGSNIRKQHSSFGWDWAPSLASMGIFRPIRIEGRTSGRIDRIAIVQRHHDNVVDLEFKPELSFTDGNAKIRYILTIDGKHVATSTAPQIEVKNPRLWWPNGQGEQPLYELKAELTENGSVTDIWTKRIGLRTIILDRHPDEWGESFQFVVNNRPVYSKGANWASPHSFPSEVDRAWYDNLLTSAADANMNMIRVWGGGVYEQESFYDLCDEKGLMVWQDFMFSCTLYPADDAFIDTITEEAGFQTKRLAHHACMALWCGNNELVYFRQHIAKTKERTDNFNRIFFSILPSAVESHSPQIAYWPGSPHSSKGWENGADSEADGDAHFYWNAWDTPWENHAGTGKHYRYSSEFGMQSFASIQTLQTVLDNKEMNAASPAMEAHEKLSGMHLNLIKAMGHRFLAPKDFSSVVYQSQINQAYYVTAAIEHQRRDKPRSMGSLYWQLNDCWPVISWSSIEFGGRWKALHWAVKRSFAPLMVSGKIINKEIPGNHGRKTIIPVSAEFFAVNDLPLPVKGDLSWTLYQNSKQIDGGSTAIVAPVNKAEQVGRVDLEKWHNLPRNELCMRIELTAENGHHSECTLLFVEPRQMIFTPQKIVPKIKRLAPDRISLNFSAETVVYQLFFDFGPHRFGATDNCFDLFPGIGKQVEVNFTDEKTADEAIKLLTVRSYTDSY